MDSFPDSIKIIIGLIVAVFWVIGQIAEHKKRKQEQEHQPEPEWDPESDPDWQTNEDDFGNPLPPPLTKSTPPPLPQFVPASNSELERQQRMQDQLRAAKKEKAASARTPALRNRRPAVQPAAAISATSIKSRLKNRSELRRAIIMREILDPPVGLR